MNTTKKITNETTSSGLVICPVCNRPAAWHQDGRLHTSPLVRIAIANLDALVHTCCLVELYTDINGQIKIHYRRKLLLNFVPASCKFLAGCFRLTWLILRRGILPGIAEWKRHRQELPLNVLNISARLPRKTWRIVSHECDPAPWFSKEKAAK